MVKIKLDYYKLWKHMRGVAQSVFRSGYYRRMGSLLAPLQNQFYESFSLSGFFTFLKNISRNQPAKSPSVVDLLAMKRQNRYIYEKQLGNISSFNFTRDAFYDKKWNEQTTKYADH